MTAAAAAAAAAAGSVVPAAAASLEKVRTATTRGATVSPSSTLSLPCTRSTVLRVEMEGGDVLRAVCVPSCVHK